MTYKKITYVFGFGRKNKLNDEKGTITSGWSQVVLGRFASLRFAKTPQNHLRQPVFVVHNFKTLTKYFDNIILFIQQDFHIIK